MGVSGVGVPSAEVGGALVIARMDGSMTDGFWGVDSAGGRPRLRLPRFVVFIVDMVSVTCYM